VPLKSYVKTLRGTSYAPSGITDDTDIRTASSITDYVVRRLALDYLSFDDRLELGLASFDDMPVEEQVSLLDTSEKTDDASQTATETPQAAPTPESHPVVEHKHEEQSPAVSEAPAAPSADAKVTVGDSTAPLCYNCGNQTQRAGSCYVCSSCGSTTGCS
jgi:ribonucleoside-diphosphate reductase alpha chain